MISHKPLTLPRSFIGLTPQTLVCVQNGSGDINRHCGCLWHRDDRYFLGGSFGQFIDVPSVLIVVGGGLAATLIRFQLTDIATAFVTGFKVALAGKNASPRDLITEISNLGEIVRKSGPLGLENVDVSDPVLAKGVQYIADGYELEFIKESMERERDLQLSRLAEGKRVFKALGDSAPAFGMIGTLVGLVQMLATWTTLRQSALPWLSPF